MRRLRKLMVIALLGIWWAPASYAGYIVVNSPPNPGGGTFTNPVDTPYSVARDNNPDTHAHSQFVQTTSPLGFAQSSYQIQTWIDTTLVDFPDVNYQWAKQNSAPNLAGTFNAFSLFGHTFGSTNSTVWAQDSDGVGAGGLGQPTVMLNHSRATFDVTDFLNGGIAYTVDRPISSPTLPDAQFFTFQNAQGGALNGGGNGNRLRSSIALNLASSHDAFELLPGQPRHAGASIEVIDQAANEFINILFNFDSFVEVDANGNYTYTYRITNHSTHELDVSWLPMSANAIHLGAAGGEDTVTTVLQSSLSPLQQTGEGSLKFPIDPTRVRTLSGPITFFAPVPLPASGYLLVMALAIVYRHRKTKDDVITPCDVRLT